MGEAADVRRHNLIANAWSSALQSPRPSSARRPEPGVQERFVDEPIRTGLPTSAT